MSDPGPPDRGTVGGNIAHADPASDLPAVISALDGTIHLQSASGERAVAAADFFVDLLTTDLGEGEIVTRIELPVIKGGSAYLKFEHPASGYAVVGAAAWVHVENGSCTGAGLALNGVCATPLKVDTSSLVGSALDDSAISALTDGITAEDPLGDVFASGEYRAHLAKVYSKRALQAARDRA